VIKLNTDHLKKAWINYVQKEIVDTDRIREVIIDSWTRCRKLNVNPWQKTPANILSREALQLLAVEKIKLIDFCVPYMEMLYSIVRSSGFVITLTDEKGIILKIIGDMDIKNQISSGGFYEGADWSEKSAGTNGIGTALAIEKPIQVYSYEHYCRCAQVSTGSCAPIRDESGLIIGTITLVGYDYNVHSHTLGMAVAVSDAIRNSLKIQKAQREIKLADSYKRTIIDCIDQAVLAVDHHGTITLANHYAIKFLQLRPDVEYIGKPLLGVLPGFNHDLRKIIEGHKKYTDKEILINTQSGDEMFNITSMVITANENDFDGMVLILEAIKRVRKIAHRMTGVVASMTFDDLVGKNPLYLETVKLAKNAGLSDFNVLLLGESGTGKDVFAQAIHNYSSRKRGPFVAINCSAIPRELISSELFGYVEGAFTGARRGGSPGKFEFADSGTIFLDEIGDMPIDLQGHLLRVIEERKVLRIGGHDTIPIDVRIIAATNRNILNDIKSGRFRQDLFYRLNVITINMIPFRERLDDLEDMIRIFYTKLTTSLGRPEQRIPESYIKALQSYSFPGNIRELQNIIERSMIMSPNGALDISHLPQEVLNNRKDYLIDTELSKESIMEDRQKIYCLLLKNKGNVSKTAKEMGIARTTLYRKMDRLGLAKSIGFD